MPFGTPLPDIDGSLYQATFQDATGVAVRVIVEGDAAIVDRETVFQTVIDQMGGLGYTFLSAHQTYSTLVPVTQTS